MEASKLEEKRREVWNITFGQILIEINLSPCIWEPSGLFTKSMGISESQREQVNGVLGRVGYMNSYVGLGWLRFWSYGL